MKGRVRAEGKKGDAGEESTGLVDLEVAAVESRGVRKEERLKMEPSRR